jgi:hypothetical protein
MKTRKYFAIVEINEEIGNENDMPICEIEKEYEISPQMFDTILYNSLGYLENTNREVRKSKNDKDNKILSICRRKAIAPKLRWSIMKRDKFKCCKCGKGINESDCLQVDHIIPVSKGGTNIESNLQTLCWDCNIGKFDEIEEVYTKDVGL